MERADAPRRSHSDSYDEFPLLYRKLAVGEYPAAFSSAGTGGFLCHKLKTVYRATLKTYIVLRTWELTIQTRNGGRGRQDRQSSARPGRYSKSRPH